MVCMSNCTMVLWRWRASATELDNGDVDARLCCCKRECERDRVKRMRVSEEGRGIVRLCYPRRPDLWGRRRRIATTRRTRPVLVGHDARTRRWFRRR